MRHFQMVVVHRRDEFTGDFASEPFEAAWASEAIVFLRTEEISYGGTIEAKAQISADGLNWIDEGTEFATQTEPGNSFIRLRHFGGWLRINGTVSGTAKITLQIALKE
ncbi:MAG: hypothetical protein LBJ62_02290 [Bifidobacteriaceae bacterium]|jgi:hypothetical protein|nr:hypothetical protein [Bifidobacteriaceae bacterium]